LIDKRKNEIVVVGTIYPAVSRYISDYLFSLNEQSFNEFDILLANDGLHGFDFLSDSCSNFKKIINVSGTAADNRRELISLAIEMGYKKVIFTDCDDTFEKNRLEVINQLLENNSVVVNDLDLTNESGMEQEPKYFSQRFNQGDKINMDMICHGNIMGLSNTAVRIDALSEIFALKEGNSIAFDWYLWACVFQSGHSAIFANNTSTKYRIYGNNTAGLPQMIDETSVCKGIEVKRQHYKLMRTFSSVYDDLYSEFEELSYKWKNKAWRSEYICALNHNAIEKHMWWENIRPRSEVGMV